MEINFLVQICLIFILAGLVKGVVGFGLPTIGIGLGALISDIPTAMMLILVPTFFTNIVQILGTGSVAAVLKKTWTFLLGAVILIPIGL
ncbi:MAG: sulfite exporter TauE/SafE family protein, partial [Litorivicinaceae bacterium]